MADADGDKAADGTHRVLSLKARSTACDSTATVVVNGESVADAELTTSGTFDGHFETATGTAPSVPAWWSSSPRQQCQGLMRA